MSSRPGGGAVPADRTTIMLISVGGAVSEGVLACLAPHRDRLWIVGTTTEPAAAAARDCDACIRVAPAGDPARFERDVSEALRDCRPVVALPCRDADMPSLARVKAAGSTGSPLLVGSVALAEAMNDKLLMATFMERCGLPLAATASTPEEAARLLDTHGFPLIAKPRRGSGTKGVHIVFDAEQLRHCLGHGGYVVQPYISPPPDFRGSLPDIRLGVPFEQTSGFETFLALRGLVGRGGELVHAAKVDVVNRFGRPFRLTRRALDEADLGAASRVAAVLHGEGYVGPFALQGRVDENGVLVYFEMLTRLGGGTAGFAALGLNQPRLLVEMFGGLTLPETASSADVVEWQAIPRALSVDDRS